MARVTGGWTTVSPESAAHSPSASIQQRHSPTRVLAARKREHYWRKTPTQVSRRKQPSEPQSTRTKPRSRSSRGNGSTTSARDLSPDTAHRSLLELEADIFPQIGRRPIADIDAPELLETLRKIEKRGALETARRLRQTCGQVFRYAIVTGRAEHDPSGDLRGALGSPGRKRGHKAMARDELPNFLSALEGYDGDPRTAIALRLMILTFVRTTELRAARWSEMENLDGREPLWRIPSERMKMKREHLVPLVPQAVALLRHLHALIGSDASPFLFPSPAREGCMSYNTMLYALYRMGYHGRATVHGFRAMASTALNEMGFRPDVIECQLAHQEGNAVRAAYNHAEYLNERRAMMKHWADWIDALETGGTVVPMRRAVEA